jgi:hypothetical protein
MLDGGVFSYAGELHRCLNHDGAYHSVLGLIDLEVFQI